MDVAGQLHGVCCARPTDMPHRRRRYRCRRAMPGVRGVFTAADLDADGIGPLPIHCPGGDSAPMIVPPPGVGARPGSSCRRSGGVRRCRHERQARDAEQIAVAYRPLPAMVDATGAGRRRRCWDEAPGSPVVSVRARRQGGGRDGVIQEAISSRSSWSTTGWSSSRSSRAPRSAITDAAADRLGAADRPERA